MLFSFLLTVPSSHSFVRLTGSWNSLYFKHILSIYRVPSTALYITSTLRLFWRWVRKRQPQTSVAGQGADEGAGSAVLVRAQSLSPVRLFVTSWTLSHQAALSQARILKWVAISYVQMVNPRRGGGIEIRSLCRGSTTLCSFLSLCFLKISIYLFSVGCAGSSLQRAGVLWLQ